MIAMKACILKLRKKILQIWSLTIYYFSKGTKCSYFDKNVEKRRKFGWFGIKCIGSIKWDLKKIYVQKATFCAMQSTLYLCFLNHYNFDSDVLEKNTGKN